MLFLERKKQGDTTGVYRLARAGEPLYCKFELLNLSVFHFA